MRRLVLLGCLLMTAAAQAAEKDTLRAGIIGLDTSHAPAFTKLLNGPEGVGDLAGVKIVAAYPGGSQDIPASRDRVQGFTDTVKGLGVEIVDSIDALLGKVDVVLIESVDGRPHLAQATPVLKAKKRLFIDKPIAASLADAQEIFRIAQENDTPVFSSSSLRFSSGIRNMTSDDRVGKVLGAEARSPCTLEEHHPDLFWYGIHGVESLFTIMGPGCERVTRVNTKGTDFVVGVWKDGRLGTYRGIREGAAGYGATVFGSKGVVPSGGFEGYKPLVVEIVKFFKTGKVPVSPQETLEIIAFMEAADESKRQGGSPVTIESVMSKATR